MPWRGGRISCAQCRQLERWLRPQPECGWPARGDAQPRWQLWQVLDGDAQFERVVQYRMHTLFHVLQLPSTRTQVCLRSQIRVFRCGYGHVCPQLITCHLCTDSQAFVVIRSALPLAIVGAHKFYTTLTDFLSLIGYWASAYGAILLVEHFYFRRSDFTTYDHADWNIAKRLPWGVAAVGAGALSFALVVPCMNQVWFAGPIGKTTGDIGFEVAFPLAGLLYVPLRKLELRYQKLH